MSMQVNSAEHDSPFGDVIYSYTRAQALEDGYLVDVSEMAREAGFKLNTVLTRTVWNDCVEWDDDDSKRQTYQDQDGRLWDVLFMASNSARMNPNSSQILYQLYRVPRGGRGKRAKLVTLKLHIGPGDQGEPVITIMMPNED